MMMEIYFDEEKCKRNNYDINERYKIIDDFFEKNNVKKIDKGVYLGSKDDFVTFSKANINLPRTKWFRDIIDKMYWRVEGLSPAYREDCMEAYYNSRKHFLAFAKKKNINVEDMN